MARSHDAERGPSSQKSAGAVPARLRAAVREDPRRPITAISTLAMEHRGVFAAGFLAFVAAVACCWCRSWAANFFPAVDAGEISPACPRARSARASRKPRRCSTISRTASARSSRPIELGSIVDNIGLPVSGTNRAYLNTGSVGPEDGDILISLNENHAPTADYVKQLRTVLPQSFPGLDLLLPARRYRQPDSEFRLARADRCAGRRARQGQGRSLCHRAAPAHRRHSRRRRCAAAAILALSGIRRRCGPHPRRRSSASPSATSPTAWWSIWRAASRSRRPSGSIPRTAFPIPS